MKSIRNKFFLLIGSLVAFIIVVLLLANNLLLQPFYVERKKAVFEDYYNQIAELEIANYESSSDLFRQIELTTNADILIRDSEGNLVYISRTSGGNQFPQETNFIVDLEDDYVFSVQPILAVPGDSLILKGVLPNGYYIEIHSPISAIQENISYVNEFLLYIGLFGLILSLSIAYVLANYFTKPIREINRIAKNMRKLDFTQLSTITSKDELGELSDSINNLAETLSKTFDNLNEELTLNKNLSKKRRDLLNNVSHELKTPLALIQGYSEGLKLNIDTSEEQRQYYTEVIMDEAKNMNRIIEDLLEIEDVDSNFKVTITENVDLRKYVSTRINKHKMSIKDKGITLIEDYDKNIYVNIDKYLVDRILTNYIVNAINYCQSNGEIRVSFELEKSKVRIKIFNTHKGFADEEIIQIWDSFYKTDQSRHRESGGHGLGLSIVKSIQEQLNEAYGVQNKEHGVEFWFDVTLTK